MTDNTPEQYDLIVIGGGPAGSILATLVRMQGRKVLLLEREQFPRYQIGESLLPLTLAICKLTGADEEIVNAGFMPKNGGLWYWGSRAGWGFDFGELPREPVIGNAWSYQVERSKFDEILLRHAARKGVDVRERHRVDELILDGDRVAGVRYSTPEGASCVAHARFVADAGGHTSPFHTVAGERVYADRFRNVALFCYYRGGKRLPPPKSGNIVNVSFDKGWFWYIPLSPTLTSLGAVISKEHAELLKGGHEEAMNRFIASCPWIKEHLADASRITEGVYGQYRVRKDWSYCNTKFWHPGLVLVGDAACFVDPLFSSGVHLAAYSALLAARSINTCLSSTEIDEEEAFREFEERYRLEYYAFFEFLSTFYEINRTKEEFFARAHQLLETPETDRRAFVRLVSGFSGSAHALFEPLVGDAAAEAEEPDEPHDPFEMPLRSDVDVLIMAKTGEGAPIPSEFEGRLVPSKDGMHWTRFRLTLPPAAAR